MALLQIAEPGSINEPHKRKIAIGIDLGTTNSLVATIKSGMPIVLNNEHDEKLTPSVVYYGETSKIKVGKDALKHLITDPSNTILSVKRLLGKDINEIELSAKLPYNFTDENNMVKIKTIQGDKSPVQVSADILSKLSYLASQSLGEEITGAVVTVPAYFNEAQRQATKQAAHIAGLNVLRLLNEPTAAAIAYGLDNKTDGTFLVYDLGGGTLDVSVLKFSKGIFQVLAVNGNTAIGGDDFDHLICKHIIDNQNLTNLTKEDIASLIQLSKNLKEQLSFNESLSTNIELSSKQVLNITITQKEFYNLSNNLVNQSLLPIKKVLRDAKINSNEIDEVIMVGGSTRMPNIKDAVSGLFNQKKLLSSIDPDLVVAIGAAIQADILVGNKKDDWLLLDVTPLSLGIETMGGLVEKIIPRNSTIPITIAQDFTTQKDGQNAMSLHIVQGERELSHECRSLAKFSLKGIPPMAAGTARIRITFQIDADGLLSVRAKEQTTGIESSITVRPSFGLADTQIEQMLNDSIKHAKEDIETRMLAEAQNKATSLITMLEHAIEIDGDLLIDEEKSQLKTILANLNQAIEQQNTNLITKLTDQLTNAAETFAVKRTNRALKQSLSGKTINEVE